MISSLVDQGTFDAVQDGLRSRDPLGWEDYSSALERAAEKTQEDESVTAGPALIGGHKVEIATFNFGFIGGSMGEVAGERIARAMERAADSEMPFLLISATGGARMQEGMRALVQMPKVVAARVTLGRAGQPFIAVLGNPTTGGVLASVGALADATIVESGATIGFAGPRVAERFTGKRLTEGSHTAENAFIRGLVDEVADSGDMREVVINALAAFATDSPEPVEPPDRPTTGSPPDDAWTIVEAARASDRPLAHELLLEMTESLFVLNGDRAGGNDPAVDVAVGRIMGQRILVLSLDRHRAPRPSAYRKARRGVALAGRLGIPIVTFIDTRGADPSEDSEAHGIAWEIAALSEAMLTVPVRTVGVVTGEGGSGGALAFAATDVLLAYEGSFFSVIGPEMAAEILWRDPLRAPEAARRLQLSAHDLVKHGIADELIPEPPDPPALKQTIAYHLGRLQSEEGLVERRLNRWRDGFGN